MARSKPVLTPTEGLVMEVLAARYRLGENLWTFDSRNVGTIRRLARKGLVEEIHGIVEHSVRAMLTEKGKEYYGLNKPYTPPKGEPRGRWQWGHEYRTLYGGPFDRACWQDSEAEARKTFELITNPKNGSARDRGDGHGVNARLVKRLISDPVPVE